MALRLLFILKAPIAGQVKTRLAEAIGEEAALEAYRKMTEHLFDSLAAHWPCEVHHTPADALDLMRTWLGPERSYHTQCEGNLGQRLTAAVTGAFDRGNAPVLLLGGDCPYVSPQLISRVEDSLEQNDVVIGPAMDGGYYLLALKRPVVEVFNRIPWSTAQVLGATLERAKEAGLKVKILEMLEDVDDLPSWKRAEAWLSEETTTPG